MADAHVDDPTIDDKDVVWRRISPLHCQLNTDGVCKMKSQAFNDSSDSPMSVDLASIACDPEVTRGNRSDFGVAGLGVGHLRQLGFGVSRAPIPENEAHCYVVGTKSKGRRRKLRDVATWVLRPQSRD